MLHRLFRCGHLVDTLASKEKKMKTQVEIYIKILEFLKSKLFMTIQKFSKFPKYIMSLSQNSKLLL